MDDALAAVQGWTQALLKMHGVDPRTIRLGGGTGPDRMLLDIDRGPGRRMVLALRAALVEGELRILGRRFEGVPFDVDDEAGDWMDLFDEPGTP